MAEGIYTLSLESYTEGVQIGTDPVENYAQVQEVQAGASGPRLILTGGIALAADQVTALRSTN